MPDLSKFSDLDIRTDQLLMAQNHNVPSTVNTDTTVPTVTAPKSTPSQPNGGGGDLDAPGQTTAQTEFDRELANVIEAGTAGVEGRRPKLIDSQTTKPVVEPTMAELIEISNAAIEGRKPNLPVKSSTTPAVDENSEMQYNDGEAIGVQTEKQPLSDKELFEQYSAVLQELAPRSFEEFRNLRDTAPERFKELEDQYRTLSMYKIDSGSMSAKEIWELDQNTLSEKRDQFTGRYKKSGNIATAYIDGRGDSLYLAHSLIESREDALKYKGQNNIVFLKDGRRFRYVDVKQADGSIRSNTYHDTEAKLFEYFADLYEQKPFTSITMLSERGMCDSCKGVMEQFKKQFPNVTVNVVSNIHTYGDVWKRRRRN